MKTNNESGAALITVLLVFTGLSVLVTPFMSLIVTEIRQSARNNNQIQAYHYARSGVEHVLANKNFEDEQYYLNESFTEVESEEKPDNLVEVEVANLEERLYIESRGKYNKAEDGTNLLVDIRNIPPAFEHPVFASDELFQRGTDKLMESAGVLDTTTVSLKDEGIELDYYESYPEEYSLPVVDKDKFQERIEVKDNTVISFGENGSGGNGGSGGDYREGDEGNVYIPEPGQEKGNKENEGDIIVEGNEAFLKVDKLDMQKDELITRDNTDNDEEKILHLLVEDSFDLKSQHASIVSGDNTQIIIYLEENIDSIKYSGVGELDSFLYAPRTEVKLTGRGAKAHTLHGGIMAEKVNIAGNSDIEFKDIFKEIEIDLAVEENFENFISMDKEWGVSSEEILE